MNMAYSELLADRIRSILKSKQVHFMEKKMMGGLTFMVNDKMCLGIIKEDLMARIDPEVYTETLRKTGCREMDFTGKPMKGYIMVNPKGIDMDSELEFYIDLALKFNPKAKSSKKK